MSRRRKCPTCWFEWLDKYNKAECPKCQCALPSGEVSGHRRIHTDRVKSRVGDIKKEQFVIEMYRQKSPRSANHTASSEKTCPVTGGNHTWRFGKCRHCSVGEGYVRYSPRSSGKRITRSAASRRGRQMYITDTRKTLSFNSRSPVASYNNTPPSPPAATTTTTFARKEPKLIRKTCPVCAYRWLDKYRKNECPKCLLPLMGMRYGI